MDSFSVLLVDDERDFVEALAMRLSLRRLAVFTATSGPEALAVLEREQVDVVVLDVRMPGMDGLQTLRAMKDKHPLIEIILLTGHADLETSMQGLTLGAFDYLLKPVNIDDLVYKMQEAYKIKSLKESQAGLGRTGSE
ncbi:MAG: response regulator [Thermodesulfobacteriota bacterium]